MSELGRRIRELREERQLRQTDLGKLLGVTGSAVTQWERGQRVPDPAMLERIADVFRVSVDYLLGRTDDRGLKGGHSDRPEPSVLAARLRALRIAKGETQQQLAEVLHVPEATVDDWENGRRVPETLSLLELAYHYGVSSEYLLGLTDDPRRARDLPPGWEQVLAEAARHHMGPDEVAALIRQVGEFLERRRSRG